MTCVIVLSTHRSGSSLVAGILNSIGVYMGDRFRTGDELNPTGYWEDLDFKELNQRILKISEGTWHDPPSPEDVYIQGMQLEPDVYRLLRSKAGRPLWGWKDPRQCLVMGCYLEWLQELVGDVRYVVVKRDTDRIVASLMHREQVRDRRKDRPEMYWRLLTNYYYSVIESWTLISQMPVLHVQYEYLVDEESAELMVKRMIRFVGLYPTEARIDAGLSMIMFKGDNGGEEGELQSGRGAREAVRRDGSAAVQSPYTPRPAGVAHSS